MKKYAIFLSARPPVCPSLISYPKMTQTKHISDYRPRQYNSLFSSKIWIQPLNKFMQKKILFLTLGSYLTS